MAEATFTFRVEEDLKSAFAEAAKAQDQTAAQLLRAFMRDYGKRQQEQADYSGWFRRQVQAGLDSARRGLLLPGEQVEAEFAERRAETLRRLNGRPARS